MQEFFLSMAIRPQAKQPINLKITAFLLGVSKLCLYSSVNLIVGYGEDEGGMMEILSESIIVSPLKLMSFLACTPIVRIVSAKLFLVILLGVVYGSIVAFYMHVLRRGGVMHGCPSFSCCYVVIGQLLPPSVLWFSQSHYSSYDIWNFDILKSIFYFSLKYLVY